MCLNITLLRKYFFIKKHLDLAMSQIIQKCKIFYGEAMIVLQQYLWWEVMICSCSDDFGKKSKKRTCTPVIFRYIALSWNSKKKYLMTHTLQWNFIKIFSKIWTKFAAYNYLKENFIISFKNCSTYYHLAAQMMTL